MAHGELCTHQVVFMGPLVLSVARRSAVWGSLGDGRGSVSSQVGSAGLQVVCMGSLMALQLPCGL